MKNRQNSFCCGSGSRGVRGCEGRACKSQNIWKINFPSVVIFCYRICFGIRSIRSWRLHLGLFGEITCCETIGKIVIFCSRMQILRAYSACRFCMQIMLPTIIPSTHRWSIDSLTHWFIDLSIHQPIDPQAMMVSAAVCSVLLIKLFLTSIMANDRGLVRCIVKKTNACPTVCLLRCWCDWCRK